MGLLWRLAKPDAARKLDGGDSGEKGGRWNPPGLAALYGSSSLALASLECWVHLANGARENPSPMKAVLLDHPDDAPVRTLRREDLPPDLGHPETKAWCRRVGEDWLASGEALALVAPSFVIPHELNVVLNPAHPEMERVRIVDVQDFRFDPRMARPEER